MEDPTIDAMAIFILKIFQILSNESTYILPDYKTLKQ